MSSKFHENPFAYLLTREELLSRLATLDKSILKAKKYKQPKITLYIIAERSWLKGRVNMYVRNKRRRYKIGQEFGYVQPDASPRQIETFEPQSYPDGVHCFTNEYVVRSYVEEPSQVGVECSARPEDIVAAGMRFLDDRRYRRCIVCQGVKIERILLKN